MSLNDAYELADSAVATAPSRRRRRNLMLAATAGDRAWVSNYLLLVTLTDIVVVVFAVYTAQWLRFGAGASDSLFYGQLNIPVPIVSIVFVLTWLLALRAFQTLDRRIIGEGSREYSRLISACFAVFGAFAIASMVLQLNLSRGYFAIALPLGTAGLLAARWVWRQVLIRRRRSGHNLERVLVVGDSRSARHLTERLRRTPDLGYDVIGACLPVTEANVTELKSPCGRHIPVFGDFDDVPTSVSASRATTLAIASASTLGHDTMQELSWRMQTMDVEIMVAPGVVDVAGPRMMVRPIAGLPLLHIDRPRYEGANRFRKAMIDRLGAFLLLMTIAPVLVFIAIVVKLDSRGPIFYRAARVGLNNRPFMMWKFRSMVTDADKIKVGLADQNEGSGLLFKMRDDPRVTKAGKVLRRYSLDELPQLFNVLLGEMSLVGPRPPLPAEVEQYDGRVARRMLVKPGMTGLWQVSGRSDLSWEESVRLDLSYVDNWSVMQDVVILWRTARAVVGKDGAY